MMLAGRLCAAERKFDFSNVPTNQPPPGCFSTLNGEGKPGVWRVLMDEVPLPLAPLNPGAPATALKSVVAQVASDTTDEHFPMLMLGDDVYGDFTLTTRFKIVGGVTEEMAGIAFRIQDEKNFYVLRVSALGKNFRFYKVVNGVRSGPEYPTIEIPKGVWQEMSVRCEGTHIHCLLNGRELMPLEDDSFSRGRIALWTKSDSISYFTDTRITYTPHEPFIQQLVHDAMKEYPRLLGLKVFMAAPKATEACLVASNDQTPLGQPGEKAAMDVINRGVNYFRKDKGAVVVTMPLRDRNGDPVAAVQITMKTFPGQTEENALIRAMPIIKTMQERAVTAVSLTE